MIEVVSLLGLSYTGKSTLAEGLVPRLAHEGITADIIKKDDAMQAIGQERYGEQDQTGGYSILGFLKHGRVPSKDLHAWMNKQVHTSLEHGHMVILEGGTRTRSAQAETLHDVELSEDTLRIFMMDLPFRQIISRSRQRRQESGRYDDQLLVAFGKLSGQYRGMLSSDAPHAEDPDVIQLNARLPVVELVEVTANHILDSRTET